MLIGKVQELGQFLNSEGMAHRRNLRGELLLTESVASGLLVAQKYAQAYGGVVGEFFDVGSSDDGLPFPCDVLSEGRYAPCEGVGTVLCPSPSDRSASMPSGQPYQESGGLIEVLTSTQFVAAAIAGVIAVCLLVWQIVSGRRERFLQAASRAPRRRPVIRGASSARTWPTTPPLPGLADPAP